MHAIHIRFFMQNTFTFLNHGAFGAVLKEALHASLVSVHTGSRNMYIIICSILHVQRMRLHFLHNFFLSLQSLSIYSCPHRICASNSLLPIKNKTKTNSTLVYKMLIILSAIAVVDELLGFYA